MWQASGLVLDPAGSGAIAIIGATLITAISGIAVAVVSRRDRRPERTAERVAVLEQRADELDERLDRAERRLDTLDRRWWEGSR